MSPDTQNTFLKIASCLVKDKIIHGIKSFFLTALVHDARSFKLEQMVVCEIHREVGDKGKISKIC